ncbi:crotonase/enoyl-CoA hydratase family protein [Microbacterium trichothecenolyticum]|uniref:Carnitinyl-CoA dehydratase n=1 Tax=Microbacterium trichothecenolyticum TaxID=69370 RepID=A0A0M2H7F1_MICTR|nr:crotonase/enoyl-CoA hydratase family protein [Microbacterium trichothecenolyticum]KJL42320.1 Carnitinyl-CoA dehydratase [Microbacterium trichothecenolyticum]
MTDETTEQPLLIHDEDGVRIMTLNRPQARNAVNLELATAIDAAVTELDERNDLRVGILSANGPTFSAGMDLKAFLRGERPLTPGRGFAGLVEKPPRKPLIAAIEGPAVAGGFEIVLACDLVVATEKTFFALPEVKRGLVAAGGGLLRLPGRIPYHVAMEIALTGEPMTAATAREYGLVNRMAPEGEALAVANELARSIAANGPLALAVTKRILQESPAWPADEAFQLQSDLCDPVRSSSDAKEGARAFTEKRPPVWTGA